ncbi:hypothetical protein PMI17_03877 [Pantoea sp. GM01]|nr:hypothetical protein PMI17_03877 [Pantoea sp. GM01]
MPCGLSPDADRDQAVMIIFRYTVSQDNLWRVINEGE